MKLHRLLSMAMAAACLLAARLAMSAQDPEKALLADFPPLSIDSVERAEEAVRRLPEVRDQLNRRYANEKADCLSRFFVASCLSDLRTRERTAFKSVNRIEVEAKAFLRRERAAERDRAVAERERKAAEPVNKPVPFSGAARNGGNGERRESSKTRIQIERIPGDDEGFSTEPPVAVPSESFDAVPVPAPTEETPAQPEGMPASAPESGDGARSESADEPESVMPAVPPSSDLQPQADPSQIPDVLPPVPQPDQPHPEMPQDVAPDEAHELSRQKARDEVEGRTPAPAVLPSGPAMPTPEFLTDLPPGAVPVQMPPTTAPDVMPDPVFQGEPAMPARPGSAPRGMPPDALDSDGVSPAPAPAANGVMSPEPAKPAAPAMADEAAPAANGEPQLAPATPQETPPPAPASDATPAQDEAIRPPAPAPGDPSLESPDSVRPSIQRLAPRINDRRS